MSAAMQTTEDSNHLEPLDMVRVASCFEKGARQQTCNLPLSRLKTIFGAYRDEAGSAQASELIEGALLDALDTLGYGNNPESDRVLEVLRGLQAEAVYAEQNQANLYVPVDAFAAINAARQIFAQAGGRLPQVAETIEAQRKEARVAAERTRGLFKNWSEISL